MSAELRRVIRNEADARRTVLEATLYARDAGFDETPARMIATVVSELVRNILKYAGSGEICLRRAERVGGRGIDPRLSRSPRGRHRAHRGPHVTRNPGRR